jgi:HlyD family secretion protein
MSSIVMHSDVVDLTQGRDGDWYVDVPHSSRKPVIVGTVALVLGFFGFGAWAALAPIDGAVVAAGTFVATGQNKKIQHLEGGVISKILVEEGDIVAPGQPLLRLDEVEQRANLRRLTIRRDHLLAIEARLQAEAEGLDDPVFPDALKARLDDPEVSAVIRNQTADFRARMGRMVSEIAMVERGISALREATHGHEVKRESVKTQIGLIGDELEGKRGLMNKGLLRKPEFLALQRAKAALEGEVGQLTAEIAEGNERIIRGHEQIEHLRTVTMQTAVEKLQEVRGELVDVEERIRAARNVLDRIDIISPVRGIVIKLMNHTIGGVVAPGATVMELLPIEKELVIEARILPKDIDHVERGQSAVVRLVALDQSMVPVVEGRVVYVSADAVQETTPAGAATRNAYITRIELDPEEAAAVIAGRAVPGMPAEVFIKTGERTFLRYLFQPFLNAMARAFREV